MTAPVHLFLANRQDDSTIHLQCPNRCTSRWSEPFDINPVPAEMLLPAVASWAVERHHLTGGRIRSYASSSLPQGTGDAGQCQIVLGCRAAVHPRDHMIDVEASLLPFLGQAAVLAAPARSLDNDSAQSGRNITHVSALPCPPSRSVRSR